MKEFKTRKRSREKWVDIPYCNGKYQVSNKGRVKSGDRLLKIQTTYDGYNFVILRTDVMNQSKKRVHRLVAEAFIENDNPSERIHVDHIDGIKTHNYVENLRWVSIKENLNNPITKSNLSKAKRGAKHPMCKPIIQSLESGKIVKKYKCSLNIDDSQFKHDAVRKACRTGKIYKKYFWKYETERASVTG